MFLLTIRQCQRHASASCFSLAADLHAAQPPPRCRHTSVCRSLYLQAMPAGCSHCRAHGLRVQPQTLLVEQLPRVAAARLALVAVAGAPELLAAPEAVAGLTDLRCASSVFVILFAMHSTHLTLLGGCPHRRQSIPPPQPCPKSLSMHGLIRLSDMLLRRDGDEVQLLVGPEGDFTPGEVDQLLGAGAIAIGLGPLRLRVETAAVALLAAATAFQRSGRPAARS